MRISAQLEFSRQTADLMDEDHRTLHYRTLGVLVDKLQAVHRELECAQDNKAHAGPTETTTTAQPSGGNTSVTAQRIRYAFKKKSIDESINDLEAWQSIFDISWLLTLRIASRSIDDALAKSTVARISTSMPPTTCLRAAIRMDTNRTTESVFLHEDGFPRSTLTSLPYCDASTAMRKQEMLIIDRIECAGPAVRTITKDVRRLAISMREAPVGTNSFGWLKCKGVLKETNTPREAPPITALMMVFKVPSGYAEPMSLRAALLQGEACIDSLSDKINLAQDLARAVSYVHIFGFVHKNIRPETILLLRQDTSCQSPPTPKRTLNLFLVGFNKFRSEDGITYLAGDREWAKCLYHHPRRQGPSPADVYIMQHDIYSLGVCLLEIGLWESFVQYDDTGKKVTGATDIQNGPGAEGPLLPLHTHLHLLALAENKLPRRMGLKYAEVVKICLTCLDEGNEDFSNDNEFLDEDGIVVGVRYVEKVSEVTLMLTTTSSRSLVSKPSY